MFVNADAARAVALSRLDSKTVGGVPFVLVDPRRASSKRGAILRSRRMFPPTMPGRWNCLPCKCPGDSLAEWCERLGLSLWHKGTVSLIVRLHYAGGTIEDHKLETACISPITSASWTSRLEARFTRWPADPVLSVIPASVIRSTTSSWSRARSDSARVMAVTVEVPARIEFARASISARASRPLRCCSRTDHREIEKTHDPDSTGSTRRTSPLDSLGRLP